MEARVKERLTGAVVLVAIVVLVVPELLSGPKGSATPPPGSHTVRIDLTGPHRVAPATPVAASPPAATPESGSVMSVRPDGPAVPVASEPVATTSEPAPASAATTPVADADVEMPPPVAGAPAPTLSAATQIAEPPAGSALAAPSPAPQGSAVGCRTAHG